MAQTSQIGFLRCLYRLTFKIRTHKLCFPFIILYFYYQVVSLYFCIIGVLLKDLSVHLTVKNKENLDATNQYFRNQNTFLLLCICPRFAKSLPVSEI